ncbi:MAG: hypothetical protein H6523_17385 [Mycolicibacterium sp.]|uniref:hypothetical protein n=1 Tax=Mycolicibacterium insubricum TaxID=444597 RepID=UPI0021F2D8B8|nr:hypothetical protein [Mycolicibacterium insubricum]MCB9442007.1 hypothetical protein [Mycolicibacterium sp.]MCV7080079.1 hypothetical protein [Mycolicibacterium insubricum]
MTLSFIWPGALKNALSGADATCLKPVSEEKQQVNGGKLARQLPWQGAGGKFVRPIWKHWPHGHGGRRN